MIFGVWISCIPLIIAAIVKSVKLNKRNNYDFSTFDEARGTIAMVKDNHTRINRVKVYNVMIHIPYYQGEEYEVIKECLVPLHMLQSIAIGKEVNLKINPKKKNDVYIQNEYGII